MKHLILSAAAASVVGAPVAAQHLDRASEPADASNQLSADSNLLFIGGIVAVAAAIVLLAEDEEGAPAPVSP